jgi:uncharacterized LabA/DUF88 family protein
MGQPPTTSVYIDGFNLYYSIRRSPNKWLDLEALCDRMLPGKHVTQIRYFTARVRPLDDPQQPQRQQVYLRALDTFPRIECHFGAFNVNQHVLPLSENAKRELNYPGSKMGKALAGTKVPVLKPEEKGSDVNLATFLLVDAFAQASQEAVVLSNDTDLVEPIRHVSKNLGIPVRVMNARARPAKRLVSAGDGFIHLTHADFAACQLPDPVHDAKGPIHKPAKWSAHPY